MNELDFSGKTVLVVGGSSGIGSLAPTIAFGSLPMTTIVPGGNAHWDRTSGTGSRSNPLASLFCSIFCPRFIRWRQFGPASASFARSML